MKIKCIRGCHAGFYVAVGIILMGLAVTILLCFEFPRTYPAPILLVVICCGCCCFQTQQTREMGRVCGYWNGNNFVSILFLLPMITGLIQQKVDDGIADRYVPPPGTLFDDWLNNDDVSSIAPWPLFTVLPHPFSFIHLVSHFSSVTRLLLCSVLPFSGNTVHRSSSVHNFLDV